MQSISCEIFYPNFQIPFYAMIEVSDKDHEYIIEKAISQNGVIFKDELPKKISEMTFFTNFWKFDKQGSPISPTEQIMIFDRDHYFSLLDKKDVDVEDQI